MSVISEELDGRSEMSLSTLLKKYTQGTYWWNRWCMACNRNRCAGVEVQFAEPLRCHQSPAVLSVRDKLVRSFTTKHWATQSMWTMPPANSNSELLTVPCGFVQLTRDFTMSFGKGIRHTMGCAPLGLWGGRAALGCGGNSQGMAVGPGSTTPPHMYPEASW